MKKVVFKISDRDYKRLQELITMAPSELVNHRLTILKDDPTDSDIQDKPLILIGKLIELWE